MFLENYFQKQKSRTIKYWNYKNFSNHGFRAELFKNKSSRPEVFCKKVVLRNFAELTGKYLCQSLFFNKFAGLRSATLLKKRLISKNNFFYGTPLVAASVTSSLRRVFC